MNAGARLERLAAIDALRAFALLGILLNHISLEYAAGLFPPGYTNRFTALDQVLARAADILTTGKFFTIFSFLFGLSFAIQLNNARARGRPFSLRFLWRLAVLFGLGVLHSLLFTGDILMVYAILGAVLLLCQRVRTRALVIAGVLLLLNTPLQVVRVASLYNPPSAAARADQQQQLHRFLRQAYHDFGIKRHGTLRQVVAVNASSGLVLKFAFQLFTGRLFITIGLFLLGLAAGRHNLFQDTPAHRLLFRRLLWIGGITALVSTAIAFTLNPDLMEAATRQPDLFGLMMFDVHQAALSAFYVAGFTLLFWSHPSGPLRTLVPAGQMGLTTYLVQSIVGVSVYYGFGLGLMGQLGLTANCALALGFFGVQLWFAAWWMRRFLFGPAEWLWRTLTYGRQPLRRTATQPAAALA